MKGALSSLAEINSPWRKAGLFKRRTCTGVPLNGALVQILRLFLMCSERLQVRGNNTAIWHTKLALILNSPGKSVQLHSSSNQTKGQMFFLLDQPCCQRGPNHLLQQLAKKAASEMQGKASPPVVARFVVPIKCTLICYTLVYVGLLNNRPCNQHPKKNPGRS